MVFESDWKQSMCTGNLFLSVLGEFCFEMSHCDPHNPCGGSSFGEEPKTSLSEAERANAEAALRGSFETVGCDP